jgi:acetylornithine deacetylase/succinyl-diaminopimelate desuccinylase-like protein
MNNQEAAAVVEKHLDEGKIKDSVIAIATTPCPQTEFYDREPLVLSAIRHLYRPAFEAAGCDTWIDDYGNLIAQQGSGTGGRKIMFLSYAMAWGIGTMQNPWSGELFDGEQFGVDGEVVWGRGGSEWHPTNAAMIETARIINEANIDIPGRIIYVISSGGHTSSSDPIYHLLYNDQLTADLCITPGTKDIVLGNCGRLDLRVNVFGKSVHSGGELSAGSNAIEGGLLALERLRSIMPFPPHAVADPDMGTAGRLSVIGLASYPFSPGYHNGVGSGGHTLQNLMRFLLDRRLTPEQDVDEAVQEIKDAIGDMSPWRITFERGALQYPSKHKKDSPLIQGVADAFTAALGREPGYRYVDYTIDAGYLNKAGIPTVMFGAIDMRFCHGDTEFTNLNDTYELSKVYANWAIVNAR